MAMKWKINLLGLAGAIIGIGAVFSDWMGEWVVRWNLIHIIHYVNSGDLPQEFLLPSVLVVLGAFVALVSPLGGFLELIGAPWYELVVANQHNAGPIMSNIGPYLAIASAIIVLTSMVRPVRPVEVSFMRGPYAIEDRLLVFSRASTPIVRDEP
jgi:hypothetical protein